MNTQTMWLLSSVSALQLAYLFWLYLFAFVFLQWAVAAAWQRPIGAQGEGSRRMQNASLLLQKVNQTSDTPGSFDWQIKALNHSEEKQH